MVLLYSILPLSSFDYYKVALRNGYCLYFLYHRIFVWTWCLTAQHNVI